MAQFFSTYHATELVFGMIELLIIIPFLIYSFLSLRKHINAVYFHRRGKTITIAWFISLSIYNAMLIIIIISYLFDSQSVESFIFSSTISTVHHMVASSSIWMNLCRCWQLYYNKKYYQGLQNAKWRSKINQNDTDFYVKYRSRIGNTIYFIAAFLWFIDGFAFFAMSAFFACPHCKTATVGSLYLTFYLFASIILCLSGIDDIFFIRRELICIIALQAFGSLLSFILNIFVTHCVQFNSDDAMFTNIIPAFIGCIISVCIIYFGIHWVIKKNLHRIRQQSLYLFGNSNNHNNDSNNSNKSNNYDMMPLKEILTDKSALDLFMQHLVREFSVENVLFLIEAANFKRLMIKLGYIDEDVVPFDFLENVHAHKKNGRSMSFSLSMPSKLSFISNNDLSNAGEPAMQLSLHESIKVVENMNDNIDTHFVSTSSFLRSLSRTTNKKEKQASKSKSKGKKKKSDKIEMNVISNPPQQKSTKSLEKETFAAPKLVPSSLLCETPKLDHVSKRTSTVTTSSTSTKRSTPQSLLTTPEPTSFSPANSKYYVTEAKKRNNHKQVTQITLENIADIDDIIDSQYGDDLNNTLDSEQLLEEEKHNEFKEKDPKLHNLSVIELKSPSILQMRSHSISKSKSPFTFNSRSTPNQKKYLETQRQMEATWINFPRNVPISPFVGKQKGGKYLNPWIIVCEITEKYIQNSSMLCINVSWSVRQTILKFVGKHEHIYQEYYGQRNRKSSLSVIFSSLSWKRKNKNKTKKKTDSVDGSYHPLEDYDYDIVEIEDNKKKKEIVDEEEVLKELAKLFDDSCMEIYCLLGDSYTRFVTTKQYQILLKRRKNNIKQWIKKKTASVVSLNGN